MANSRAPFTLALSVWLAASVALAAEPVCLPGAVTVSGFGLSPRQSVIADLNGDDALDLAVGDASSGSVYVLLNDGSGVLQDPTFWSAGGGAVPRHPGRRSER